MRQMCPPNKCKVDFATLQFKIMDCLYHIFKFSSFPKPIGSYNFQRICHLKLLNPLGPTSDQHQFSPNIISRSSRVKVMRITKLITKGRTLDLKPNSLNYS